jgi:hypothetical protein
MGKANEISRTLTFGGLAVIWLFRKGNESSLPNTDTIPDYLQLPLVLFVFSLGGFVSLHPCLDRLDAIP